MIGSLCTGYGGLDMAAHELTGQALAFVSDVDPGARMILAHHHPDVPNIGDLTSHDFTPWAGMVRTLTAGYPCQPFSKAGMQRGTADPRHLFPHVARAISEIRPELVLLENVRGHVRLGLDAVVGTLAGIGYDARWTVVRASDVGAPHERARVYLAAYPHGGGPGPVHDGGRVGRLGGQDEGAAPQRQRARAVPERGGPPPTGLYTPAITRWERHTRPAPPIHDRAGELSPTFVEWMMGLPAGHVTDVPGLSPEGQRKALGNGVVPQAALAAYRSLGVGHE